MATYKVIQDIEAEDKLLGPLTLRQFIYAAVVIVLAFICFKLALVNPLLIIPFLPPMIFFAMLAAPFGHDQSSEVWLLAKIGFFLKPKRRIWDQTGLQELVTITVPKKVEKHLTDGLSQTEVKSRLRALATTIDTRGWAVKNVNVNVFVQPTNSIGISGDSDRLVSQSALPQDVPTYDVTAGDDMMDAANNPTAQHLNAMIAQSEQSHHQSLVTSLQDANQTNDAVVISPSSTPAAAPPASDTKITDADIKLLEHVKHDKAQPNPNFGHMRTINPLHGVPRASMASSALPPTAPPPIVAPNPALLRLASNDDLNVATIARQANKEVTHKLEDEVVVSLR